MIANERAVPEDDMFQTSIDLGALHTMVYNRISRMSTPEKDNLAKKIIAYVLRDALDGGPINDAVMVQVYENLNDILGGGILMPTSLINRRSNR